MDDKKKILFIHHGGARGGAFLSLLSLLRSLDRAQYEPIVCNGGDEQDPQVGAICSDAGFQTCACKLPRFTHTTGGGYRLLNLISLRELIRWIKHYSQVKKNFIDLLDSVKPDLVHFNSLTLAPYACVSKKMGIPTVVHVRESVLDGIFGVRKYWLVKHLNKYADKVIAICKDNLERLSLPPEKTVVIYNQVDFDKFDYRIDSTVARKDKGISMSAKVVLFAGGSVWKAKGLFEFLEAMTILKSMVRDLICLMPAFQIPSDPSERTWTFKKRILSLLGVYRENDFLFKVIQDNGLSSYILNDAFVYDIERWIAASDVVCVPHIEPHFSRTVIEAGAMKKPAVAFKVGGVEEVVSNGETGLLVERGDVTALAQAISSVLSDVSVARRLGAGGYKQAVQAFDAKSNAAKIANLYREMLRKDKE